MALDPMPQNHFRSVLRKMAETEPVTRSPRWQVLLLALMAAGVVAAFVPALDVYFAGDDFDWLNAAFEVARDPLSSFELINTMWRPVVKWSFLVDFLVFGRNSIGYSATNLLIHIFNAWLLYLLISRLVDFRLLAAVAATGFALSPFHSEAVLWASSRGDTMLLTCWLGALLILVAQSGDTRWFQSGAILILVLIGAGSKESWVVFPFIGTAFLVIVLKRPLRAALGQMRWLWLTLFLYIGVFNVLPTLSGAPTSTFYADFSPSPALEKICRLILTFCGLGELGLDELSTIIFAGLVAVAAVTIAVRQGNRNAQWSIFWTAATLALAAPFSDVALRHNYLPLAGFWMTLAFVIDGLLQKGDATRGHRWRRTRLALLSSAAVAILMMEGLALQREIDDYRRYGDLHRELAEMLVPIEPHIPRERTLLFINRGERRAVEEIAASVAGVKKSFFVRRDAIWQMVFFLPLANFLGTPFVDSLLAVPEHQVSGSLGGDVTVLVFSDNGFRFGSEIPDGLVHFISVNGRLPETVGLYRYQSYRRSSE